MDSTASSQGPQLGQRSERSGLFWTFFSVLALAALVMGLYFLQIHGYLLRNVSTSPTILVSVGYAEAGTLYTLNIKNASSTAALFEPSAAEGRPVIDYAQDAATLYYVILNSNRTTSNIYSEKLATQNATPTQVTNTPTIKFQLSYDAPSHMLAFVSGTITNLQNLATNTNWNVSVLNTVTGVQKVIGKGTYPAVLPGGIMVIVNTQGSLSVINDVTGKEVKLLSLAAHAPFAVSSDGKTLALYNPTTKNIDYFDISQILSASYTHSQPTPFVPTTMTYTNGTLLLAGRTVLGSQTLQLQFEGSPTALTEFTSPLPYNVPEKIIWP